VFVLTDAKLVGLKGRK